METAKKDIPENERYMHTEEYKAIKARHDKLLASGEEAWLDIKPCNRLGFGGLTILDTSIKDKYGNIIINQMPGPSGRKQMLGLGPAGALLGFHILADLPYIYAIKHSPIVKVRLQFANDGYIRKQHQFKVVDAQLESEQYAKQRLEAIKYQNQFYSLPEEMVNFLCTISNISVKQNKMMKAAALCKLWDAAVAGGMDSPEEPKRKLIMRMLDSPDLAYYKTAYECLEKGNAERREGFYQTHTKVYMYNDEVLGSSIDNVVAYLKEHDEIFVSFNNAKKPEGLSAKPE